MLSKLLIAIIIIIAFAGVFKSKKRDLKNEPYNLERDVANSVLEITIISFTMIFFFKTQPLELILPILYATYAVIAWINGRSWGTLLGFLMAGGFILINLFILLA